jgi:FKBP-type peptidyl-prolyl cis-trans isomerase FklB
MTLKLVAVLVVTLLTAQVSAEETLVLKTPKDKVSYAIGVDLARNLKQPGVEVDVELMLRGLKDGLSRENLLMTDDELRKTMNAFQSELRVKQAELRQKQAKARAIAAEENKKEGDAFLAENKKKEGVVTLPSGLQYRILKEGAGKKPAEVDTVEVNYRGTLVKGTDFDSSDRAGKPATFKVTEVIPGWKEALKLMPVGSKWQLFIPSQLAYGVRGLGDQIGPNATLIFELELLASR